MCLGDRNFDTDTRSGYTHNTSQEGGRHTLKCERHTGYIKASERLKRTKREKDRGALEHGATVQ